MAVQLLIKLIEFITSPEGQADMAAAHKLVVSVMGQINSMIQSATAPTEADWAALDAQYQASRARLVAAQRR
jgi:ABC-type Fe3+ transport system substrate-binding protein